jgi:hypothetical protein
VNPSQWIADHLAADDGPLDPHDLVRCPRMCALLKAGTCAARQAARLPSGGGAGFRVHRLSCGRCEIGREYAARLPKTFKPRGFRPFDPVREVRQRIARKRLYLTGALDPVPTCDGIEDEPGS